MLTIYPIMLGIDKFVPFTFRVDGKSTGDFTNDRLKEKIRCDIISPTNKN